MSPVWPCLLSLICLVPSGLGDVSQAGGAGKCKKPADTDIYQISGKKSYYDVGESVTVICKNGYRPLYRKITCVTPQTEDEWDNPPQCRAQCEKPMNTDMYTISGSKASYDVGDRVTVRCRTGYRTLHSSITCLSHDHWSASLWCVAQCKKPADTDMYTISGEKSYYDVGESVSVHCKFGYFPLHEKMTCETQLDKDEWDYTPQCRAKCKKPADTNIYTTSGDKAYYDVGESVMVNCKDGYRPLQEKITCGTRNSTDEWDNAPQCRARCNKLKNTDMYTISGYKPSYDVGDRVTVRCKAGYRTLHSSITCVSRDRWSPSPQCVEQCKKPSIRNLEKVTDEKQHFRRKDFYVVWDLDNDYEDKKYYNLNDKVTLQCKSGYYPTSKTIQCTNNGDRDVWTPTVVCIEIKGTIMEVTSTSIHLNVTCTPDLCQNTWTSYIYTCIYQRSFYVCEYGKDVTFSGLEPFTPYEITIAYYPDQSERRVQTLHITTRESVPPAPVIVQTPSMENTTIIWNTSDHRGNITGSELNIVAWRDYNSSFSLNITEWFPPNVTQYKINLEPGTNYTFRIRGFTSVGGGEYRVITMETPIGASSISTASSFTVTRSFLLEGFMMASPSGTPQSPVTKTEATRHGDQSAAGEEMDITGRFPISSSTKPSA